MKFNIYDVKYAAITIKEYCKTIKDCNECIMFHNCHGNRFPENWVLDEKPQQVMTNKEAIEKLGYIKNQYHVIYKFNDYDEVIDLAIKALKEGK